jgi:hypothetical protein
LTGKTLSLITLFGLYMRLLDSISSVNSRCGIWTSKPLHTTLLDSDRMNLDCTFNQKVIPCLEFTMEFQSNQLIYQKEYTKRQQVIYVLINHLHDTEGWGYRKISQWLNKSGIKTLRGKNWFSSSVISVLKRKHERDLMNEEIRNQHFPSKISKFEVNYYIFD